MTGEGEIFASASSKDATQSRVGRSEPAPEHKAHPIMTHLLWRAVLFVALTAGYATLSALPYMA